MTKDLFGKGIALDIYYPFQDLNFVFGERGGVWYRLKNIVIDEVSDSFLRGGAEGILVLQV